MAKKTIKTMDDIEKSMQEMNDKLVNGETSTENVETVNLDNVKEALDNVDADKIINSEEEKKEPEVTLSEPIKECIDEVTKMQENQDKLMNDIKNVEPQKAVEEIKKEIAHTEEIKEKLEKIIDKNKLSNGQVSYIWNGMRFDY